MSGVRPAIAVVGSVNLDLVARAPRLPAPGETVGEASLARYPGGKGANQALAARRLGAAVDLFARVGRDAEADLALALLRAEGVDLAACLTDDSAATGVALIVVGEDGENQITVAPGANARFCPSSLDLARFDAVVCQLEIPMATVELAARETKGLFCLNPAPALPLPPAVVERADLLVMNESEARASQSGVAGHRGLRAITLGADGAVLLRDGEELARARPPKVTAVDTTGAGDVFTAALALELVLGSAPSDALAFACAAGALATTRPGAQPSFPTRDDVERLLFATSGGRT